MGEFLVLQQRSKHPRQMVVTPKASTSSFEAKQVAVYRWGQSIKIPGGGDFKSPYLVNTDSFELL